MRLEETAVNTFQNPQTHHFDRSTRKGSKKGCLHLQTEALSMIQIKEEQYSQYVGMLYWVALKMWPLCSSTWRIKVGWWEKGASAQPTAKWKDEHSQLFNFSSGFFYLVFLFPFQPSYPIDNPNQHPSCRGTKPPWKQAGNSDWPWQINYFMLRFSIHLWPLCPCTCTLPITIISLRKTGDVMSSMSDPGDVKHTL